MSDLLSRIASIILEHVHAAGSPTQNMAGVDKAAEEIVKALVGGEGPTRDDVWNIVKKILDSTHSTGDVANIIFEMYAPHMSELLELRQRIKSQRAEIERLRGVVWDAQNNLSELSEYESTYNIENRLCAALGHKFCCDWTINKSLPCDCGGIEVTP